MARAVSLPSRRPGASFGRNVTCCGMRWENRCLPPSSPWIVPRLLVWLGGSPYHLVGQDQQAWRDRQPQRLGGLQVEDQLAGRGLFHRQVRRFRPCASRQSWSTHPQLCVIAPTLPLSDPRAATRTPARSLAADWSPAPRRPPAGHPAPPGAPRPSSPEAGSGAPARGMLATPVNSNSV
jgi:hypothetical protein